MAALVLLAACGSSDAPPGAASTTRPATPITTSTTKPTSTTAPPPMATEPLSPASVVVEPDAVGSLLLGSTRDEAVAILGEPSRTSTFNDLSGQEYTALEWDLPDGRALGLNYRRGSKFSPGLTDWTAASPGPRTAKGIQVGHDQQTVEEAYGTLKPFIITGFHHAVVARNGTELRVLVSDATKKVERMFGGDPGAFSRSIAD